MTLQPRDKRALALLALAVAIMLVLRWTLANESRGPAVNVAGPIAAEKRVARLRRLAAALPGKKEVAKQVSAELAGREKGVIQAETAAQAQAQLLQIIRRVGKAQGAGIEIRSTEIGQVRPLGDHYGEAIVSVTFECRIEELLNLLTDLNAQSELLATQEMRVAPANQKEKAMNVRLTVSGLVFRSLVPEKKGPVSF